MHPAVQRSDDAAPPLKLSAEATGSDSVTVSWTAPETDLDLLGYELGWRRADEATWNEVRDIPSTQTTYTITGLEAGTAYEVRIRAVYAGEEGEWSPVIAAGPTESRPVPSVPPNGRTASSLTVTWTAPETDLGLLGYELGWRRADEADWNKKRDIPSTQTTYEITGLDADTAYEVRVRAMYAGDKEGEWSPVIAVATTEPLPVLSQGARTVSSVTVSWTAPETDLDLLGYELGWRRADEADWTERDIPSTRTTHEITGLEAATAYEIRVRAMYAGNKEGEWSSVFAVETATSGAGTPAPRPAPRTPPIFRIASVTTKSITLSLTATDAAITGYDVSWKRYRTTPWDDVTGIPSTQTAYTITGLHWLFRYEIRVRTVTGDAAGEWFYAGAVTRRGYNASAGPRVSVRVDDAVADEGDGEVYFVLDTPDSVTEALTVYVFVGETRSMLRGDDGYSVRMGVGTKESRFRVRLAVDTVAERDSLVIATVLPSRGYDVGAAFRAYIKVRDDD